MDWLIDWIISTFREEYHSVEEVLEWYPAVPLLVHNHEHLPGESGDVLEPFQYPTVLGNGIYVYTIQ